MKTAKNVVMFAICVGFLFFGGVTQAFGTPFQNGDFGTGDFTGWSGDLIFTGTVSPDTDSHFNVTNGSANVTNDSLDWSVTLFQDFTLDALLPGWTMDITFWIQWGPSDSSQDSISAQIQDTGYNETFDLLQNVSNQALLSGTWVTQDITLFAQTWGGQEVEISFTIDDGDYGVPDSFSVDNISFNQHAPAPVPEPATVLLLGSGLIGLYFRRFGKKE